MAEHLTHSNASSPKPYALPPLYPFSNHHLS